MFYFLIFILLCLGAAVSTWKLWFPAAYPHLRDFLEGTGRKKMLGQLMFFIATHFPGEAFSDEAVEKLEKLADENAVSIENLKSCLEASRKKDPANEHTLSSLGGIYMDEGEYKKAFDVYKILVGKCPDNNSYLERLIELTDATTADFSIEKSIHIYEELLQKSPGNLSILKKLGLLYQEKVDVEKTTATYSTLLKLDSNYLESYGVLADINFRKRNYEESFGLLKVLISLDQAAWDFVRKLLSKALSTEGTNDSFTTSFATFLNDREISLDSRKKLATILESLPPSHPQYFQFAILKNSFGETGKAIDCLRTTIAHFPNRRDLFEVQIKLLGIESKFEEMVEVFKTMFGNFPAVRTASQELLQEYSEKYPNAAPLQDYLLTFLERDKNVGPLIENLRKKHLENPDDPSILKKIATTAIKAKDIPQAIDAYEKLLSLNHEPIKNLEILGNLHLHAGNGEKAKNCYAKIVAETPSNSAMVQKLADLHLLDEEYDEAVKYLEILSDAAREDGNLRFKTGETYYVAGNYGKAITHLQMALAIAPDLAPYIHNLIGHSRIMLGETDLAKESFRAIDFKSPTLDHQTKIEILYRMGLVFEERGQYPDAMAVMKKAATLDSGYLDIMDRIKVLTEKIQTEGSGQAREKERESGFIEERLSTRYKEVSELGRGGMGIIYKAVDKKLNRPLALKVLPDNLKADPEILKRFLREAQAAASLNHPNIVQIFDVEQGNPTYIAMEFIDGENLRDILKRDKRMPVMAVKRIALQVAMGLDYAHSMGVVHRDIKPDNIMLNKNGEVKITDFGLAKIEYATSMTQIGVIMGTEWYMSPEQLRGLDADKRSDIYSLGIFLYELLTGRPPFYKGDVAYQHINVDPPSPREKNDAIPEELDRLIMKCIAKKADRRFQNCKAICDLLKKI